MLELSSTFQALERAIEKLFFATSRHFGLLYWEPFKTRTRIFLETSFPAFFLYQCRMVCILGVSVYIDIPSVEEKAGDTLLPHNNPQCIW